MESNRDVEEIIDVILESKQINEGSRERRAINALQGKNKRVKTFAILTAENPMGDKTDPAENKELRERLINTLNQGRYFWYKVKGKYGNYENSIMVFNITEEAAVRLGRDFRQHGIIWCEKKNEGKMEYHLWERPDDKKLVKVETKTVYDDLTDADDFYTKISKGFKFSIPFDFYKESVESEELDRYITESVDTNKVGSYHFAKRCAIKKIIETL